MKTHNAGFTLMELLIVVAILGILATITVSALGSAKKKGEDSAIKEQMTTLRTEAELFASDNGESYAGMFTGDNTWSSADTTIQAILDFISDQTNVHTAGSSATAWAAQAQLKQDITQYVCVSSTSNGLSISTTAMAAGATVCP